MASSRPRASMDPAAQPINCPSCGAPAPFRGTAVSLVCEFCGSTIVRTGVDAHLIGKVSAIVDNGSPVILGARGRHLGVPFEVAGRLQVAYERGSWNEWYLEFANGTVGWLADALGQFAITLPRDPRAIAGRVPPFTGISIAAALTVDGVAAVVVDKRVAAYRGAEGILPFPADPGVSFYGVDLRGYAGEFVSLDYHDRGDHDRPDAYIGEAVDLTAIGLHPLRPFEGWPRPSQAGAQS